ncbi:MAG: hypothetical protein DDT31_02015 [Syntrophomonadaceae bacterium]|nr:hypothetical protein [Bacillota bacterium]
MEALFVVVYIDLKGGYAALYLLYFSSLGCQLVFYFYALGRFEFFLLGPDVPLHLFVLIARAFSENNSEQKRSRAAEK